MLKVLILDGLEVLLQVNHYVTGPSPATPNQFPDRRDLVMDMKRMIGQSFVTEHVTAQSALLAACVSLSSEPNCQRAASDHTERIIASEPAPKSLVLLVSKARQGRRAVFAAATRWNKQQTRSGVNDFRQKSFTELHTKR